MASGRRGRLPRLRDPALLQRPRRLFGVREVRLLGRLERWKLCGADVSHGESLGGRRDGDGHGARYGRVLEPRSM